MTNKEGFKVWEDPTRWPSIDTLFKYKNNSCLKYKTTKSIKILSFILKSSLDISFD